MKNIIPILTSWRAPAALAVTLLFSTAPSANAELFSTAGGILEWTNAANWTPSTVPNAVGASAIFNDCAAETFVSLAGSSNTAGITIGSLTFNQNITGNLSRIWITNGVNDGPLRFNNGGSGVTIITTGAGNASAPPFLAFNLTIAPVVFQDTVTVNAQNEIARTDDGNIAFKGFISGPGGFIKEGTSLAGFSALMSGGVGSTVLAGGQKSYSGPTVINAGRMRMSVEGAPTNTSSITVNTGAQFDITSGGTVRFGPGPLILNGRGAIEGPYTSSAGAMRNERGTAITNIVILNDVVLASDTLIHIQSLNNTGNTPSPKGTNTLAGTVSGPGMLEFTAPGSNPDAGVLILNGHNTYSGGTLVNGGILEARGALATFGTTNVTVDNAQATAGSARISIASGVLDAIDDSATLFLNASTSGTGFPSGYAILGDGVNEYVAALNLDGVAQALGTYGSSASSAVNQSDIYWQGTGIVTVGVRPPSLTITLAGPNVIISWPTNNSAGYTLEQTPNLNSPITWSPVTQPVIVSGANNTVTVPVAAGNVFYRLRKP
ncbi:MAG: autotransporter-associated beta strand repeat-containing protein [Verrucomicrobiota bacterium]